MNDWLGGAKIMIYLEKTQIYGGRSGKRRYFHCTWGGGSIIFDNQGVGQKYPILGKYTTLSAPVVWFAVVDTKSEQQTVTINPLILEVINTFCFRITKTKYICRIKFPQPKV